MKHLTVRNIPEVVGKALETERLHRGSSLNQTVIDLLAQSLGVGAHQTRCNGLGNLAGTWSNAEADEFDAAVAVLDVVDEELWR